jgi:hypothetical protein
MSEKKNTMIAIPCGDYKVDVITLSGLLPVIAGGLASPYFHCGDSNVRHMRNAVAHYFMTKRTDCDTLVWVDSDIGFSIDDFGYLMEGPEELAFAPYARKSVGAEPVTFGFGFVRTNRSVFEKMNEWVSAEGEEMLYRYFLDGELAVDYFFDGATPDSRWMGEDVGFFHYCALLDIHPRIEKRCRLTHVGRFNYGWPDQTPGLVPIEAGAQ